MSTTCAKDPGPDDAAGPLGEPLLTAGQVAEYLQVDRATVYRLAAAPEGIPVVQVSDRTRRFRPEDVRAYVERKLRESPGGRSRVARLLGQRRG